MSQKKPYAPFNVLLSLKTATIIAIWPLVAQAQGPLFQSSETLNLQLSGEFDRVHKENAGGNWTGEDREDAKYWTDSVLVDANQPNRKIRAKTRARGMSSAQEGEAEFPKLRVEILDNEELKGTVFQKSRNFRINTHVNTEPKQSNTEMGRLNDERSPFREALGLEIAQALNLPSLAFRRARISYEDTGLRKKFTRQALILETDKKLFERYGAKNAEDFPPEDASIKMPVRLAALFHLFHIFIGNDDVGLKMKLESSLATEKYRPLFNTVVMELKNGQQLPVVADLDLAYLVAGDGLIRNWKLYENPAFGISDGKIGRMVLSLAWLRARLSQAEFQQVLGDFSSRESQIRALISKAEVDEGGRTIAREQLSRFKKAVAILAKNPMLLSKDVRFFADKNLSRDLLRQLPVSEEPASLRPGTAIQVLGEEGQALKVAIIDSRFDLVHSEKNIGYIKKQGVQLGFDLPAELQGLIDERDMAN